MNSSNSTTFPTVSIVIPVLNAEQYLPTLYETIKSQQSVSIKEIILIYSSSADKTFDLAKEYADISIVPIANFSHGKARNLGAQQASGEIIVFLSQDAYPKDTSWLFRLLLPFNTPEVVASYSRQIPKADAIFTEQFFLQTRFPPGKMVKRVKSDPEEQLTFEGVFFSNVSSAARRSILLQYPFDEDLIMSEDQQFSKDVINAGYAVVYAPESVVVHSHNYSLITAFKRYFDSVYSLSQIFPTHGLGTSAAIGTNYLRQEIRFVLRNHPLKFPYYFCYTLAKTAATILAHFTPLLPKFILRKLSLHSYYWK